MNVWQILIGGVALIFSAACFFLFFSDAIRKKAAHDEVVQNVKSLIPTVNADALAALAKGLADALSKLGPGAVALVGAILFLLLSGVALQVYQLSGGDTTNHAASQNAQNRSSSNSGRTTNSTEASGNNSNTAGNGT